MKTIVLLMLMLLFLAPAAALPQEQTKLYGWAKWGDNNVARGVVMSLGSYSVATNAEGYYEFAFLRAGNHVVSVTPPGKPTRSFTVNVNGSTTRKDFVINW